MTLHALLIGINAYDNTIKINGQAPFSPLNGCVRDAQALHDWLLEDKSYTLNAKLLFDKEATKANIVAAFRDHLSLAEPGDSILVFYSGHGTVEYADAAVWREESDGRLEGLACYYEAGDSGKFILADKELRYLLKEISKPNVHVVTLFDCCHSGDNTRSATDETVTKKQSLIVFQQRQWSDFIFSDKFKRDEFIWESATKLLPEGQYLQLAASESNEPALEAWIKQQQHGVFAYFLLEILRETGGEITYRDLCNRIRNRIRYKYGQRIKIYTPGEVTEMQDGGFLKKAIRDINKSDGAVDFNAEFGEYRINRGILDRVLSQKTKVTATDVDGSEHIGMIGRAELDTAEVIFDETSKEKLSKKGMKAKLEGLASRPLRICFVNKDLTADEAAGLSEALFSIKNETFIQLESDESRADYTLLSWAGMYYITKPGDWYRPEVMPVFPEDEDGAKKLLAQFQHMAQWHFMLDLKNETDTQIPTDFLKIEITDLQDKPLTATDGVVDVQLKSGIQNGQTVYTTAINIRLTNNTQQDIYVQPVFMMDFGCLVHMISNPVSERPIEPGGFEYFELLLDPNKPPTKNIPLKLDDSMRLFNRKFGAGILKFIISLEPITGTSKLDLTMLPTPDLLTKRSGGSGNAKGAFPLSTQEQTLPTEGWNAQNIVVRFKNPLFDTPDWKELEGYMDPKTGKPALAHFITGLYLEQQAGSVAKLAVRTDFNGLEKGGFFSDTILTGANYWSNFRRNQRFRKMAKKYPDLPILVSEGDSWFQHPLLEDIIDNIGNQYPIYCLAAAGDTIRNYFSKGKVIEAVRDYKPAILVLSGGGNDILGENMPNFLAPFLEGPELEGEKRRFFAPTFEAELEDICGIYRNLFEHFKTERPDMPILLHSYDYPRPRPTGAPSKSNWLGKYFDDKKIVRAGDRMAAAKHMIDEFNSQLKIVCDDYPDQVHFLDLRNLVRENQWDDEIHPNNSGFQNVSGQFLRKISELLR